MGGADASDLSATPEFGAAFDGARHEAGHDALRVDKSVGRAEASSDDVVRAKLRQYLANVVRREQFDVLQTKRLLPGAVGAQIVHVPIVGGHEQIAMRPVSGGMAGGLFESGEERNGVNGHADVHVGCELRAHAAHAFAGGPKTLPSLAFNDQHVLAACFGKMKRDAGPDDSGADDDHVRGLWHEP